MREGFSGVIRARRRQSQWKVVMYLVDCVLVGYTDTCLRSENDDVT